jgi:hypothetical protein
MSKIIDLAKQHYLILVAALMLTLIRFTSAVPILFLADSPKYTLPDVIIKNNDLNSIWISINFSLFERVINYFIQTANDNDISFSIVLNKLAIVIATLLFYLIVYRSTNRKYLALALSLIFSLNPALLYIEQVIMPEAFYILFVLIIVSLMQEILIVKDLNLQRSLILSAFAGLIAGVAALTKQTADNWILSISLVLLIVGIYQLYKSNRKKYVLIAISSIFFCTSLIPKLPIYWENYRNFGQLDLSLNRTIDSARGVLLWSLTEEMVYANPPTSYPWLTQAIIQVTENIKANFVINDKNSNSSPFYMAISRINVIGREGRLTHPQTGNLISIAEWSDICSKYWFDVSFYQPDKLLKRVFQVSFVNMFVKEDLGLFILENSMRPEVHFQSIQYTEVPFSFKDQFDPKLFGYRAEIISIPSSEVSKVHSFNSYFKLNSNPNSYFVMVNQDLPYAFRIPVASFSVWWQKLWTWFPWIYIIGPIFLVALVVYVCKRQFRLFDLFILGSCAYYTLLPLLFSLAEARYRLQFIHFMLIFIAISFARRHNKEDAS